MNVLTKTFNRIEKINVVLFITLLSLYWNWHFVLSCNLPHVLQMNDVPAILDGYRKTPNLWLDGLSWWSGSWIQSGIYAFRPLASYLYWVDSYIGLKWGFIWVGWIGVVLLIILSSLSVVLAWRFTKSKLCVLLAAILAPWIKYHNGNPDEWLVWYPVHQELLLFIFVIGALICFDIWYENGQRKYLVSAWVLFFLGCLTKEYTYIFPVMAIAVVLLRRSEVVTKKQGLIQAGLMLLVVLMFWFYRAAIITEPRNPPMLKRIMLIRRPFLFFFYPFYRSVLTEQFWFPGLSVLIAGLTSFWLRWPKTTQGQKWLSTSWARLSGIAITVIIVAVYCHSTYSLTEAFWYLFEPQLGGVRIGELSAMIGTLYSLHLLWKYRREEPTAAAFALMILSYAPAYTYLGWHYTIPGWFFRSAYWALVAKLVWIDLGRPEFNATMIRSFLSRKWSKKSELALENS